LMPLLEALTLGLGSAVVKTTAKLWLKDYSYSEAAADAGVDALKDLFKKKIDDFETRRATARLFDGLQDEVARRLLPVIDSEFPHVSEDDRIAATLAVAGGFQQVSLPVDLFTNDLDIGRLEALIKQKAAEPIDILPPDARPLALLLVRESCNYVL